jgi:hypothetical protein
MNDVEARLAGGELDHDLLALLLFGDLLGFDFDAGEFGKFLDVLLQIVAARAFGEDHFQLGAGIFLPREFGECAYAGQRQRAGGGRARKHGTTSDKVIFRASLPF